MNQSARYEVRELQALRTVVFQVDKHEYTERPPAFQLTKCSLGECVGFGGRSGRRGEALSVKVRMSGCTVQRPASVGRTT